MARSKDPTAKQVAQNNVGESDSFEYSFQRLSEMAEQLEAGGLTLAEATSRFEEGMRLVQFCNQLLNDAELKITELKESYASAEFFTGFSEINEDEQDQE